MERTVNPWTPFERTTCLGDGVIAGISICNPDHIEVPYPSFGNEAQHGPHVVARSVDALASHLHIDKGALKTVRQVHGKAVLCLHGGDNHDTRSVEADAIVSDNPHDVLGIKVADCCAILMVDVDRRVVAACHSGWRGTALGIAVATIEAMEKEYGVQRNHVRAWLSPCASGQRYRVGDDVAKLFPRSSVPLTDGGWLYDNAAEIRLQLRETGVERVTVDGRCTIDDSRFHSYRRQGAQAGRTLAFIKLAKDGEPTGTELV